MTIIHRREEFRASRIMLERARANEKIRWRTNTEVLEVLGEGTVTGVRLRDTVTGEESVLAVTGVFMAIGHDPRSELVAGQVDLDEAGLRATVEARPPTPTSTACSRPATWWTTPTGRPSPPPARAAAAAIDAERWLRRPGGRGVRRPHATGGRPRRRRQLTTHTIDTDRRAPWPATP